MASLSGVRVPALRLLTPFHRVLLQHLGAGSREYQGQERGTWVGSMGAKVIQPEVTGLPSRRKECKPRKPAEVSWEAWEQATEVCA